MWYFAALSLVIAVIAVSLGFTGIAVNAMEVAKIFFFFFLVLFTGSLLFGLVRRRGI